MTWRNLYQAEKERERARVNAAAMRELARRHRDEFEAIRRELTPATGTAAKAAPEGIGERPAPEAVAVPVGEVGSSSFSSASSAEAGFSTLNATTRRAVNTAGVKTTTA